MSFISRFKYPALIITALVFAALEITVRFLPMEYASGAGVFMTNHRKNLAESSAPEFDYIVFGDSRSMSLMGHAPTPGEPYSMYNFSLPAMGQRYFKYYLRKYLRNRTRKPSALIFAGDPAIFQKSWSHAYHDPQMIYSDSFDDSLGRFLWNRFDRRLTRLLRPVGGRETPSHITGEMIWDVFSHRYLHLFDIGELSEQLTGAERVFILREAIPLTVHSYKFRDALVHYTFGFKLEYLGDHPLPSECRSCAGLQQERCYIDIPRIEDNKNIERDMRERYGQINLGNRLTPSQRYYHFSLRDSQIEMQKQALDGATSVLDPLEDLVKETTSLGIRFIMTDMPSIDAYRDTKYHREYFPAVVKMLARYPGARMIRFSQPYYPRDLFIEQVHYECLGSERLNRDFFRDVMPKILEFAPPRADSANRGFEP